MANDVQFCERHGLGLATIQACRGVDHRELGKALGIDLQDGPGRVGDSGLSAIGTGPGTWLIVSETISDDWADHLSDLLSGLAAVFDQSSGNIVLRLSGRDARKVLKAGTPIDLEPGSFGPMSSATTSLGHVVVVIWKSVGFEGFDLAFSRSYRESLVDWLSDASSAP